MEHRGEIIEKEIRESGIPLTTIAKRMGKTRQWLYLLFENPNVSLDHMLEIGKIIYHNLPHNTTLLISFTTSNHFRLKT
jgi:hypothetical protein